MKIIHVSALILEDPKAFRLQPRESLIKMAENFDEVASPLLFAGLMTSRGLALNLRSHIPIHIRRATLNVMAREDERRFNEGELLTDKDELMALAQKKETFLLEFEAEMRGAGLKWNEVIESYAIKGKLENINELLRLEPHCV